MIDIFGSNDQELEAMPQIIEPTLGALATGPNRNDLRRVSVSSGRGYANID